MTRFAAVLIVVTAVALLVADFFYIERLGIFILPAIAAAPFAFVGALLIVRIGRNPLGWLLGLAGVLLELPTTANAYAWSALVREPGRLPGGELAALVSSVSFGPALGLIVITLLVFPTGHGLGGRWTWVERTMVLLIAAVSVLGVIADAPIPLGGTDVVIQNPLAVRGPIGEVVTTLTQVLGALSALILAAPVSLFVRYRRSSQVEREQIKWLAYSGTLAIIVIVLGNLVPGGASNVLFFAGLLLFGSLPIAIAIAIFRYRLYDIDVLIRRTLIYAVLSAVLIVAYVGGVALFETVLAPFTGGSGVAVAISTLAVVALFQPLRRRIQRVVDRRFYREQYDAERTLDVFAARLRDQIDLASLQRELLGAVSETVQPAQAGVWLRR
jgi:hypothetical protein